MVTAVGSLDVVSRLGGPHELPSPKSADSPKGVFSRAHSVAAAVAPIILPGANALDQKIKASSEDSDKSEERDDSNIVEQAPNRRLEGVKKLATDQLNTPRLQARTVSPKPQNSVPAPIPILRPIGTSPTAAVAPGGMTPTVKGLSIDDSPANGHLEGGVFGFGPPVSRLTARLPQVSPSGLLPQPSPKVMTKSGSGGEILPAVGPTTLVPIYKKIVVQNSCMTRIVNFFTRSRSQDEALFKWAIQVGSIMGDETSAKLSEEEHKLWMRCPIPLHRDSPIKTLASLMAIGMEVTMERIPKLVLKNFDEGKCHVAFIAFLQAQGIKTVHKRTDIVYSYSHSSRPPKGTPRGELRRHVSELYVLQDKESQTQKKRCLPCC